jgi:hypothetical protein
MNSLIREGHTPESAERQAIKLYHEEPQPIKLHSYDITPQMRQSITEKGQPLNQIIPAGVGAEALVGQQEEAPEQPEMKRGGAVGMAGGGRAGALKALVKQVTKKFAAPQDEALRLAQQRAALPVEQYGLGLPAGNTAAQRAAAMGINTDAYHGSKQNITGAFKPGYDDNLGFVTKDPEFANSWIGKGKIQQRADPEAKAELKAAEDLYNAIKEKHMDYGCRTGWE